MLTCLDAFCQFFIDVHLPHPPGHDAGKQVPPPFHRGRRPDGSAYLSVDYRFAQSSLGRIVCQVNARIKDVQEQVRFRIVQLFHQEVMECRDVPVVIGLKIRKN